jgi:hypothetical protein
MAQMNYCCRRLMLLVAAAMLCHWPSDGLAQKRGSGARRTRDVTSFRKQLAEKREKLAADLEELARVCDEKKFPDAAAQIRLLARPVDSSELRLSAIPRMAQPRLPPDLPPDERYWQAQLRFHQQAYAKELYALSRQALGAGHVSFAVDLIREIVRYDSDHAQARKILGFVPSGDEWVSAFEAEMAKQKKVWTDQYGWLPKEHVDRYAKGERYYNRRWMTADKEAQLRRDFDTSAWEIRTEHYLVKTNHSLERGVDLAKKLEDFHGLFFQMMAGFFNSADEVQKLFQGSSARRTAADSSRHVVHFYRARDEYIDVLKKLTDQQIGITKGIYFPKSRIAYFFFDPENDDDSTLYHEATHQLLTGSRPMTGEIGIKSNFWIIEGIACYMESFQREGERFSVGDPANQRLQAARIHFLEENYYVPLREFTRMGMQAFQSAKEIRKNYSQGAALTHFFMHYDDGRYREALIEHLSQIYSPTKAVREGPDTLDELTGVEDEELDRQYAEYIRRLVPLGAQSRAPSAVGAEEP